MELRKQQALGSPAQPRLLFALVAPPAFPRSTFERGNSTIKYENCINAIVEELAAPPKYT
jgi:hypothetical protein